MSTHGSLSEVELFNLLYKSSFNKVCNFACFYVRNKQVSEDKNRMPSCNCSKP